MGLLFTEPSTERNISAKEAIWCWERATHFSTHHLMIDKLQSRDNYVCTEFSFCFHNPNINIYRQPHCSTRNSLPFWNGIMGLLKTFNANLLTTTTPASIVRMLRFMIAHKELLTRRHSTTLASFKQTTPSGCEADLRRSDEEMFLSHPAITILYNFPVLILAVKVSSVRWFILWYDRGLVVVWSMKRAQI